MWMGKDIYSQQVQAGGKTLTLSAVYTTGFSQNGINGAADLKFVVTSVTFPLEYIALIFVFVAVTILAVQQLSDSGKYRFRYDVLKKLGMKRREVDRVIFRQLAYFVISLLICTEVYVIYFAAIYLGFKRNV